MAPFGCDQVRLRCLGLINVFMCGIAGIVTLDGSRVAGALELRARRMAAMLAHRGPDDEGSWEAPSCDVAISHRRLSIVDLSMLGHNPMFWDGGRLAITYNGEIYNFLELRQELEQLGHRFRSHTDTEVVLAAYDQWGLKAVERFVGMFAFGLWDAPRKRLWLVRDRLGKKPLYYSERNGELSFASELKSLLADTAFDRRIDPDALRMYLRYGYVPAPLTIFATARKLPPAHELVCEGGRVSISRYWDPLDHLGDGTGMTEADATTEFESLLGMAVRQRRIADVSLGAFLSGGIDSSLIVALMREQSADPVKTYTVRFENAAFNEADHAAAVARHLGTEHHESVCDEAQMLAIVDRIPDMFDEPFADSSAIPTYLVSKAARSGVTVALSGDGGDELFFGYPRYRYHADASWVFSLPAPARRLAAAVAGRVPVRRVRRTGEILGTQASDPYARFITWCSPETISRMSAGVAGDAPLYHDMINRTRHVESATRSGLLDLVSYLPDDILTKVDRASMAVGLEVRAPLLDHRIVEFALGLPLKFKRRGSTSKWLLRKLLYGRVPKALLERPKMGFGVPLHDWFRGPLSHPMEEAMRGEELRSLGLDPGVFRSMWQQFKAGKPIRPDIMWQALMLVSWSRRFLTARAAA